MSIANNTVAINTSTSKQKYTFSKAGRFVTAKTPTNVIHYEQRGLFRKDDLTSNEGRAFQRSMRFSYYHSPQKEAKVLPSPDRYTINGYFGKEYVKNNLRIGQGKNNLYSFGVSRDAMKTIHIDDINKNNKKRLLPPGPGSYEPKKTFGNEGTFKSFHSRLKYDNVALKREAETPGPFQYNKTEVLSMKLPVSVHTNAVGQPFSQAKDRFRATK